MIEPVIAPIDNCTYLSHSIAIKDGLDKCPACKRALQQCQDARCRHSVFNPTPAQTNPVCSICSPFSIANTFNQKLEPEVDDGLRRTNRSRSKIRKEPN
jgi:hypothetical protein